MHETEIQRCGSRGGSSGRLCALLVVVLATTTVPSGGLTARQDRSLQEAVQLRDRPSLEASRLQERVTLDGRLDESAWARARAATEFVQGDPREGAEPVRPTEVRILYDSGAIYVGARMHDDGPSAIADQLVRRDEQGQYDYFEVLFDPNLDRRTGYLFRVSASGVERDAFLFRDTEEDVNWDAVWGSAVHVDSAGWSVEMRIPLSQIRYESRDSVQTWGVNFRRRRLASNSVSYYALVSRTTEGIVSQSGRLTGLLLTETERRFELEPFLATELFTGPSDPGNPFFDGTTLEPRAGLNVNYGIGSAFSLDATFNPDFGQVEVDPAVVNLSAFETFFPEKRPFFVQDARVFDFELASRRSQLFFSRRIGRDPHRGRLDGSVFTDVPDRTTILGASKLTGRTQGGLSVGILGAVTPEETGRALMEGTDEIRTFVVEPASRYAVARVQQDFRNGTSRVGAILTGVDRSLPRDGTLDELSSSAFSGGLDFQHAWGGPRSRRWSLTGYLAVSHVRGSPEAMVEIQTNPQHYFQRPDADELSVDSTATHLTGVNWNLEFARQSAEHWTWSIGLEQLSPDFSINDMGFNNQGEQFDLGGHVAYQEIEPGSLFRNWNVRLFTFHEFRHELLNDPWSAEHWARSYNNGMFFLRGEFEFLNNWSLDLNLDYGPQSLSHTATRGGPLMTEPGSAGTEIRLRTDRRKTVSLGPSLELTERFRDAGGRLGLGMGVSVRPTPGFELEVEPTVSFEDDAAQFVEQTDAVPYAPTFGRRYLFVELGRTELSVETRLRATFTPDLSLQLFVQPLISSGDFESYRQLARPESFDFRDFEEGTAASAGESVACLGGDTCVSDGTRHLDFDGDGVADFSFPVQDFNLRSIRGNAVLRWEYLPGSTLFLVWQQNLRDEAAVGDFRLGRDLEGLFGAPARNTFIVKVNHYLDL